MARSDRCFARDEERPAPPSKRSPKTVSAKPARTKTAPAQNRGFGASVDVPGHEQHGPPSGRRIAAQPASAPPASEAAEDDAALCARFEQVISQISIRMQQGSYVAEQCTMLVEIARISASARCPAALRDQALEMMLKLGRRPQEERPCRRGVREMVEQCLARGIVR